MASRTQAVEFQMVAVHAESRLSAQLVRLCLQKTTRDLHHQSAAGADKMVVVFVIAADDIAMATIATMDPGQQAD
ncbi:MAG: hypothetical protein M1305_03650 [Candidatus Marsarchaeota archaeon]|nr:hypothetical protein [Candidatus Marsarchaeota archaeon]